MDLRKDVFKVDKGFKFVADTTAQHGDPDGYREIFLKSESHLEPISDQADRFSIIDHDSSLTRQNHRPGDHRYFVAQTFLNADLFINLPKWKTHSKTGLTGALKNLVGINGDKAYLPHFRRGFPRNGGDQYADNNQMLSWLRNSVKQLVWRRSALGYSLLRPCWKIIEAVCDRCTRLFKKGTAAPLLYVAGGGWYGNQTIWRMIYDLNMVAQRIDRDGNLHLTPQRNYFCIVDGLIAGEGEGPLRPAARPLECLAFGDDPFEVDTVLSWFMGYDPEKMPILSNRREFMGASWGDFDLKNLMVMVDGVATPLFETQQNNHFTPPAGWLGHVER